MSKIDKTGLTHSEFVAAVPPCHCGLPNCHINLVCPLCRGTSFEVDVLRNSPVIEVYCMRCKVIVEQLRLKENNGN